MIRLILPALLLLLAACDLGWRPAANDNNIGPLKCPGVEVEHSCDFRLAAVPSDTRFRTVLVCAADYPGARAAVVKVFPSACDVRCRRTGGAPNNDTQAADGEPGPACEEAPAPSPTCGDPGATCGLADEPPCCSGVCSLSVCE